ncbi:hypothetical protein KSF_098300 [Reticulibacter mediterranei]|uniref:Uncharacterized protein n=1 Tax=Reticulibacter mediterranei TaxID=2778369 RepID=A0A8J3N9X3_9CHLR|nr:hypothetical protein [Reticulibacter mediterranei]GHO99782.1 hypothetical protein KSF_098300 [Reticulibacter mediterranei]
MKRERRRLNPVWLVFIPPALARGWLLFHTTSSTDGLVLTVNALLLLALSVLTWLFATDLADAAGLWQRAKERFVVMATLSALAPPLSIAVAQASHWGSFTVVEVVSLCGLRISFRLLSHRPACVASRKRWYAWVFSCLLSVPGLWLIGSASALFWPLDSRSWLALSIPEWHTEALALLPLAQLWVVVVCMCGLLLALGSTFLSFWWHHRLFLQLSKLVGGVLLFCGALAGVGALTWIMHIAPDGYIYILQAFALMIPVCNAAFFALPYMITEHHTKRLAQQTSSTQSSGLLVEKGINYGAILHATFLAILSLYFCSQLSTYIVTGLPHR